MKLFEKLLFALTVSLSFLGSIGIASKIITILLLISCIIYLLIGWFVIYPDNGIVFKALPFWVTFLIAQTTIVIIFGINNWPMKNLFSLVTFFTLLATILILVLWNNKLFNEFPIKKFQTRLFISWMISGMPMYIDILK